MQSILTSLPQFTMIHANRMNNSENIKQIANSKPIPIDGCFQCDKEIMNCNTGQTIKECNAASD